jgi:hypothetical protein
MPGSSPSLSVAISTRDKVVHTQDELLKWIKNLNPGFHTKHWRVLDKQSEPKGQKIILLIDQDSLRAINTTGYKNFTGLSQGNVEALKDLEAQYQKEKVLLDTASSKSVSDGDEDDISIPSDDQREAVERKEEIPLRIKSIFADRGPL